MVSSLEKRRSLVLSVVTERVVLSRESVLIRAMGK